MELAQQLFEKEPYTKFRKNPTGSSVADIKLETNKTFTLLTNDMLSVQITRLYCITAYGLEVYLHLFLYSPLEGALWSPSNSRPFTPGKAMPMPIEEQAGWATELFGCLGVERKLLPLPGIEPRFLGRPTRRLVTILTEVLRLFALF